MSQLTGKIAVDFSAGTTIYFVCEIEATLQDRIKVIYEIFDDQTFQPILRIFMDRFDRLMVSLFSIDGQEHSTEPIGANKFAAF